MARSSAVVWLSMLLAGSGVGRAQGWDVSDSNGYSPQLSAAGPLTGGSAAWAPSRPSWSGSRTRTSGGPQMAGRSATIDYGPNPGFRESPAWNVERASRPWTFGQSYGTGYSPNYLGAFGQSYGIGYGHNYFGNPGQMYGTGYGPKF